MPRFDHFLGAGVASGCLAGLRLGEDGRWAGVGAGMERGLRPTQWRQARGVKTRMAAKISNRPTHISSDSKILLATLSPA